VNIEPEAVMASHTETSIEEILDNFSFLDDWDDRYRYIIELGKALKPLPEAEHNDTNKVQGCVSQVWLWAQPLAGSDPVMHLTGDSDAHIVRGLVAITLALYSDKKASDILKIDAFKVFSEIGLEDHLTPQRSNGLRSMIERINRDAKRALEQ
jgi:cysteine desulfuration protein SufE